MIERVTKENLDQYEAFIKKHPKGLFQHSSKWAKVKSAWKWEAVMLRDEDGNIKGSADVLIRTVPVIKASLLYCCRGFVADEDDFATFVERVDQQKQTVQQSLDKLELMKKALMQEYFG